MTSTSWIALFFFFFFSRVKTGKPAQSKYMQMLYSVSLDLVRSTKNPRYLNLSGFPTKVEFQSCNSQFLGQDHIILCSRNDQVYDINEAIFQQFNPTAEVHMLRSVDSVSEEDGMHYAYPVEFLQQLNAGGLPPALLCLKLGSLVILLRNQEKNFVMGQEWWC